MRLSASALILCVATGCAAAPQAPRAVTNRALPIRTCNPEAALPLVGSMADEATLERAKKLSGARSVRVLRPGRPQAMNYSSGRLNAEVDRSRRITRFSCG
jgi:hypothetical protein